MVVFAKSQCQVKISHKKYHARAFGHHGEIVQGPIMGDNGQFITALITLPRSDIYSQATFVPSKKYSGTRVKTIGKKKAQKICQKFYEWTGYNPSGIINIHNSIKGSGCGSSSCDCLAVVNLLCKVSRINLNPEIRQRLIFEVEGATDPLAILSPDCTPVYGSRSGLILERLPGLPKFSCLGFQWSNIPVDTNLMNEKYTEGEAMEFHKILSMAKDSIIEGSAEKLIEAATQSAILAQRHIHTPNFFILQLLAEKLRAGISISHSGNVGCLLFSEKISPEEEHDAKGALSCLCNYFNICSFDPFSQT